MSSAGTHRHAVGHPRALKSAFHAPLHARMGAAPVHACTSVSLRTTESLHVPAMALLVASSAMPEAIRPCLVCHNFNAPAVTGPKYAVTPAEKTPSPVR